VRALPGVRLAAAAMPTPLAGHQMGVSFEIEGRPSRPGARPTSDMAIITPGYFATIATPLVAGRDFDDTDDHRHPRVTINQAFADKFFPGQSPIGRRIRSGATGPHDDDGSPMREIVGIVGNARQAPVALGPEPIYYLPFRQMPWGATVLVRSELPPETLLPALRRVAPDMDSQVAVHGLTTLDAMLARGVAGPQLVVLLMGSFAVIAPPALMLAVASALVVVTALVSATVPARRAASVEPTEALRSE
jgi:MacB-like periplasmic core domain